MLSGVIVAVQALADSDMEEEEVVVHEEEDEGPSFKEAIEMCRWN